MDPTIDVLIEDARWSDLDQQAQAAGLATFAALGLPMAGFSLCVMGCDDARIMALNADFRGKPKATNVLSWPTQDRGVQTAGDVPALPTAGPIDDPEHLGDIAISYDTCAAEAKMAEKPMADHVTHLIIHGILHLFGYDHITEADGDLMEALEVRILADMGLPNPYA